MSNKKKEQAPGPRLEAAVDLVHLNAEQRLKMVGRGRWQDRRRFLETLLGTSAAIVVPSALLSACGGAEGEGGCACQAYSEAEGCACQADAGCACQADANGDPCADTSLPRVTAVSIDGSLLLEGIAFKNTAELDEYGTDLSVRFSKPMAPTGTSADGEDLLFAHLEISPVPVDGGYWSKTFSSMPDRASLSQLNTGLKLHLEPNTTYTLTVRGTATDQCGHPLDGNGDGSGGTDFVHQFTTGDAYVDPTCPCQADTCGCQADTCGCQSYTCACESFDCSCQFEGCPVYGI